MSRSRIYSVALLCFGVAHPYVSYCDDVSENDESMSATAAPCSANILPDGGPYTEIVNGLVWTFGTHSGKSYLGWGINVRAIEDATCGDIEIPSALGGRPVVEIGRSAFLDCSNVTSVVVPSSVRNIEHWAFGNCQRLCSVNIPSAVTNIGQSAFSGCMGLTSISIPNGVTILQYGAFWGCSSMKSIALPSSVTNVEPGVFVNCSELTSVNMGNGVKSIGKHAFSGCENLVEVKGLDGLTYIGEEAFYCCRSLSGIELPNGLLTIGKGAFEECSSLESIVIPSTVTNIGAVAFEFCPKLDKVDFEGAPPTGIDECRIRLGTAIRYNVAYSTEWQTVIAECGFTNATPFVPKKPDGGPYTETVDGIKWTFLVEGGKSVVGGRNFSGTAVDIETSGTVVIPERLGGCVVTGIGYGAFLRCSRMQRICLPQTIERIHVQAFDECSSLSELSIPDAVCSIEHAAFANCTSLVSIAVSDANLHYQVVDGLLLTKDGLTFVSCPAGRKSSVEIPKSVRNILPYAMEGCVWVPSVELTEEIALIGDGAFKNCKSIRTLCFSEGMKIVGGDVCSGCGALESVRLPPNLEIIGFFAFLIVSL